MYKTIVLLSAVLSSVLASPQTYSTLPPPPPQPKPTGTNLGLGESCDPSLPNACANGVDCYATNFMLIPRCGNFQASCTSDAGCAFNKCFGGLCSGPFLPDSSASSSTTSSSSPAAQPTPPPRPTGTNLGLGENCDPALPNACANSNCYATNSMLIPVCGNFQASCTSDANCAFNTCNTAQGLCNGFKPSASPSIVTIPSSIISGSTATPVPTTTTLTPVGGFANATGGTPTTTRAPSASVSSLVTPNGATHVASGIVGVLSLFVAALLI